MGVIELNADFESYHIEGYARAALERGQSGQFSAPLISHVLDVVGGGELWQGGCIHGVELPAEFDLVVSLYPWEQYNIAAGTDRIELKAFDSPDQDPTTFIELADLVAKKICEGSKVLVHCQAGLNRSGLLAALVLRSFGYSSRDAIDLLRENRSPMVLCNESFEKWLLMLDDEGE